MKKLYILFSIFLISLTLYSCKSSSIFNLNSKPSTSFYTECLKDLISNSKDIHIKVLCLNYYKAKILSEQEKELIYVFTSLLKDDYFINKPDDLPSKVQYKMFIEDDDNKYVINVYSSKYISIHPWDGKYEEDFLDISDIFNSYNTYDLCKYFISTLDKEESLNPNSENNKTNSSNSGSENKTP